jgi:Uncharacterized protein conserved in bacteria (DUF2059)
MKFFCLAFVVLIGTSTGLAQQPAKDAPSPEEVLNLFTAMHVREQTIAVMHKSEEQIKTITRDLVERRIPNITPLQLGELDAMIGDLYENYPVDQILGDMVPVYQKHLTSADIDSILGFYTSPVGQKLTREMPAMTEEAMQIASSRIQEDNEAIMRRLEERIQKMSNEQKQTASPKSVPKFKP